MLPYSSALFRQGMTKFGYNDMPEKARNYHIKRQVLLLSALRGRRKSHDVGWAGHGEAQQNQTVRLDYIRPKRPFATAFLNSMQF